MRYKIICKYSEEDEGYIFKVIKHSDKNKWDIKKELLQEYPNYYISVEEVGDE